MYHSDQKRFSGCFYRMMTRRSVRMAVRSRRFMKMRMDMQVVVMRMSMKMESRALPEFSEQVGPENDEHDGYRKFHPHGNPVGYLNSEENDKKAHDQKRYRMPETPEGSDKRSAYEPLPLAHDRGDRYKMVRIESVL